MFEKFLQFLLREIFTTPAGLLFILVCLALGPAANALAETDAEARWDQIRESLFGQRSIEENSALLALDTPYRAEDAAVVPISVTSQLPQTATSYVRKLYLVIDENPSPVAAVFNFPGPGEWQSISTRIRVNRYTNVRAIADTSDGRLVMASNFVKASGGCSAPSLKDPALAAANLGRMKLQLPEQVSIGESFIAQIMVRHPNSSGLQFDQVSRNFIPADFVRNIEVSYNGEIVFTVDADISISEDPSIHFGFKPERPGAMQVRVTDSEGRVFDRRFEIGGSS